MMKEILSTYAYEMKDKKTLMQNSEFSIKFYLFTCMWHNMSGFSD